MGRGVPIDPDVRAAIVADLRATIGTENGSVRKVASRHGVSRQTVVRIAQHDGITWSDEGRHKVQNAIETYRASAAEQRAALSQRMLEAANRALTDMESPATIYNFGGKDNTYAEREVARPPTADQRNLMIIAATAIDKHKILDQYDSDARSGAMLDRWLNAMIGEEETGGSPSAGR